MLLLYAQFRVVQSKVQWVCEMSTILSHSRSRLYNHSIPQSLILGSNHCYTWLRRSIDVLSSGECLSHCQQPTPGLLFFFTSVHFPGRMLRKTTDFNFMAFNSCLLVFFLYLVLYCSVDSNSNYSRNWVTHR